MRGNMEHVSQLHKKSNSCPLAPPPEEGLNLLFAFPLSYRGLQYHLLLRWYPCFIESMYPRRSYLYKPVIGKILNIRRLESLVAERRLKFFFFGS